MRFASLASSSRYGNAYLVESPGGTRLLVDYGVSLRRLEDALASLNIPPSSISAILISHEHTDHTRSLRLKYPFHVRHGVRALFASAGVWNALGPLGHSVEERGIVCAGDVFWVGDLCVTALAKPHDAQEPLAFLLASGRERLGVLTDTGTVPPELAAALEDCHYLIMESNHDVELERRSGRHPTLISRVMGEHGHLSNHQAGSALARMVTKRTRAVLLAHLSLECNTPTLAHGTVSGFLWQAGYAGRLAVAPADSPTGWLGAC